MKTIVESGKHVQYGQTVQIDHNIKTFQVTIRTNGNVGCDTVKDLIEKKHEVLAIAEIHTTQVVRKL